MSSRSRLDTCYTSNLQTVSSMHNALVVFHEVSSRAQDNTTHKYWCDEPRKSTTPYSNPFGPRTCSPRHVSCSQCARGRYVGVFIRDMHISIGRSDLYAASETIVSFVCAFGFCFLLIVVCRKILSLDELGFLRIHYYIKFIICLYDSRGNLSISLSI